MHRKPTHADAELLIRLYEIRREPELRRARRWFLTDFKATTWDEIKRDYLKHTDEDRWFRQTTSYWEMVGALVNRGVLNAELFFEHGGEHVAAWKRCEAWIEGARADIRPTYLHNFEKVVRDHLAYRARTNAAALRKPAAKPRARARKR